MKIKRLSIKNFRAYKDEATIDFDDLTAIVGPNDIGKSTILEALEIFFNESSSVVKWELNDINKTAFENGDLTTVITVEFTDLPDVIVLDEAPQTTLKDEYLLSSEGTLVVLKKFEKAGKAKTYIKAYHPSNPECCDLLVKKIEDLRKIQTKYNIQCDNLAKKVTLRKAIWSHFKDELQFSEREMETSGDGLKDIWPKIEAYLPIYSLFQSDRNNSDNDKEVQDPIKSAIKAVLANPQIKERLAGIANEVIQSLGEITGETLNKLQNLNPELANSLNPSLPKIESLRWNEVFKSVSLTGDNDIPMNKRGSGVRRLLLLSFFQAEAERRMHLTNHTNVIYAIEEPETSQHYHHQELLIKALKDIAASPESGAQVIITTHSAFVVKQMDLSNIRLVKREENGCSIEHVSHQLLPNLTLNEVNYTAFGELSIEYHDELFGYLQDKAILDHPNNYNLSAFDNWLRLKGCSFNKTWIKLDKKGQQQPISCTLQFYIRNKIHHPENQFNISFTMAELQKSIEEMRSILES